MDILEANLLVKRYGAQTAVDEVSFRIQRGEIVGFLGPNGAGKSTTMKIISGILEPDEGTVRIMGKLMDKQHPALKQSIAYLPENNPMYTDLYVRESLEFMARIHQVKNPRPVIDEAIRICGLSQEKHKKIGELSKGYRQRVGLAQTLLHQPDLFILDEATTGLDPNQILEIRDLIKSLGKEHAVLMSTHILQEVESICTRCIVIHRGKLIADEPMASLKKKLQARHEVHVSFGQSVPLAALQRNWKNAIPGAEEHSFLIRDDDPLLTQHVYRWAVENKLLLNELKWVENKMEDIFYSLTGQPSREPQS